MKLEEYTTKDLYNIISDLYIIANEKDADLTAYGKLIEQVHQYLDDEYDNALTKWFKEMEEEEWHSQ